MTRVGQMELEELNKVEGRQNQNLNTKQRQTRAFLNKYTDKVCLTITISIISLLIILIIIICVSPQQFQELQQLNGPRLNLMPHPYNKKIGNTIIDFESNSETSFNFWTKLLDDFLISYRVPSLVEGRYERLSKCNYYLPKANGHVCDVNINYWHPCTGEYSYGYNVSEPCLFLILENTFGWIPEYFNNIEKLPQNMPNDLKEFIRLENENKMNTIWVSCSVDNDKNGSKIEYIPTRGFPGYYYPEDTKGFLSPLVAIQLKNIIKGKTVRVKCDAWAVNLPNMSVMFDVLIT